MLLYKIVGCFLIILNFYRPLVKCDYVQQNKNKNSSEIYNDPDDGSIKYLEDVDLNVLARNKLFTYLYPSISPNSAISDMQQIEEGAWHWVPYKRIDYFLDTKKVLCPDEEPNEEFPESIFTMDQLRQGAIVLYFIGVIYFFTLLTIICDTYFIPTVERICDVLKISKDVAAATFMATATTTPEFFTNVLSTFILDSDLGIGTVIGSLMFNTLGVAAVASLAAPKPLQIDWWPITRDSILYSMNLSVLIGFAWDGVIFWYEAMVFVILWVVYFVILFQNNRIMRFVKRYVEGRWNCCNQAKFNQFKRSVSTISSAEEVDTPPKPGGDAIFTIENKNDLMTKSTSEIIPTTSEQIGTNPAVQADDDDDDEPSSLWKIPRHSKLRIFWFFYTWPIKFLLTCLIPNPRTYPKLFPLSFLMCVICIGANSYLIVWMVVRIGETLSIPDSVMGLTLLAAGGCLPEAISAVLMARKGDGALGVSNSLGANSLAIVYALGLPWFIRTMVHGGSSYGEHGAYVSIHSYGIEWVILSLILTVIALYGVIALFGYKLRKVVGILLILIYIVFVTFAILVELDVFFPSGNVC